MRNATLALARGAWLEQFNQLWRFSRTKAALLLPAAQVGLALLLLWRLEPAPAPVGLILPVTMVATVTSLGAFVFGLLRGREELYGRSVLRALHVSPATGLSILIGLTLAGLPQRLFTSLLMAAVIGLLLPAGSLWWTLPLLWALALVSGLAGYSAALISLVGWVRVTPRSLAVMWAIAMALGFGLATVLLGLVSVGGPVAAIVAGIRGAVPWLITLIGTLVLLPGLVMGVWAALRPGRAGEWYREAYLNMQEAGDPRRTARSSRWPRLLGGAAGAIQAREWREIWLNWFTWVRLALSLLLLVMLFWPSQTLLLLARGFPVAVIMGLGLTASLGAFGELPATVGGSDGPNIGLSMVAGVRAAQVVWAKWVACLPLALLSAACTGAASLLLKAPSLSLSLAAGAIGLGFGVIAMAGGLHDLDPHAEVTEREVPAILRAVLEQIPRKLGGLIGYFGGLLFTVAAVWIAQYDPEAVLAVSAGCAALAHLALLGGYRNLKRMGM